MPAGRMNITLEQGARWDRCLKWQDSAGNPIILTGREARMHVRAEIGDAVPALVLTSTAGDIDLEPEGVHGFIRLRIGALKTAALTFERGVYDLELYNPSDPDDVVRLIEGKVKLRREVTR